MGFASVALRRADLDSAEAHLGQAKAFARTTDAKLEHALVSAYIASRRSDQKLAESTLLAAEPLLGLEESSAQDRACYRARWLDQRGYLLTHYARDVDGAHALYAAIEPITPFAACRQALGLSYIAWKRGRTTEAEGHARDAAVHAGDGGFLRLRVMALNLSFRITGDETIKARAEAIARGMEDEALVTRVLKARR
jgi:hypothetical protein